MWSADQLIVQSNKNLSIQNAVLFVLMLLLIRILWSRRYYYIVSWQLPGPVAYPIIGNLPTLLRNSIGRNSQFLFGLITQFTLFEYRIV